MGQSNLKQTVNLVKWLKLEMVFLTSNIHYVYCIYYVLLLPATVAGKLISSYQTGDIFTKKYQKNNLHVLLFS